MRTFYSLTKRQFLGMTKFNKFLYGNSKEKKVFAYTFFAIGLTAIILFFCCTNTFRCAFRECSIQTIRKSFSSRFLLKKYFVFGIIYCFFRIYDFFLSLC